MAAMDVDDDVKQSDNKTDDVEAKVEDPDEFTKSLPKDATQTTAKQQRILAKKLGLFQQQEVGDSWYPINRKWYDSWKKYIMWDKGDDDIDGGLDAVDDSDIPRPGRIDNSDLADLSDENALRRDLTENLDYNWVHGDVWKLLHSWYRGGPAFERKVYERSGASSFSSEKYICQNPRLVKLCYCDDKTGDIDLSKTIVKGFPMDYKLNQVVKELESAMEWTEKKEENSPYLHVWLKMGQVREIYTLSAATNKKKIGITLEDLADLDGERWVEIPDDFLKTQLDELVSAKDPDTDVAEVEQGVEDLNLEENDNAGTPEQKEENKSNMNFVLVIERKQEDEDKPWPRAAGDDWREKLQTGDIIDCLDDQSKWYECLVRMVYPEGHADAGKFCVHYIGWMEKWDELLEVKDEERVQKRHEHSKKPHRPRPKQRYGNYSGGSSSYGYGWGSSHESGSPDQPGVVGLRNLGNTCFMNSTIQCLAQAPGLTQYFLTNEYMHHVNKANPLGWKGKVANAWALLLHDMFSGKYKTVAPRQFKNAIGEVAPRFMGYAQQDSQELLSFLLDGLHEDLNQIKDKPSTQPVDSAGRPDTVVALEAWKTYLSRNQSKIVDLMQAQYRSELVCPDCSRVSVTFDPYMFLSVPLPTEKHKVIEYTWIDSDLGVVPKVYGQKMLKVADIGMLKQAIAKRHQVSDEELFVCDVWKSKIHRELRRHDSVGDINRKSDDIFVYHSKRPDVKQWVDAQKKKEDEAAAGDVAGAVAGAEAAGDAGNDVDERENEYSGRYRGSNLKRAKSDFQTFVINNQHRVRSRHQYGVQERTEDEVIGYPLLVTLPMKVSVTTKQIRAKLFELVQPMMADDSIGFEDDWPFVLWAQHGFNKFTKLVTEDDDAEYNLNQRNLKFIVQWNNAKHYKRELYPEKSRPRDDTAPPPLGSSASHAESDRARQQRGKPIKLDDCLHAFCEKEILSENDAWYCSNCKGFKEASKQIDLWDCPDLLIIHLKRFNYTRNWRDRINTLVQFPVNGLDVSQFLKSEEHKATAKYDLFAVSNHMGGMGGGHYTAYAKNLDNKQWYHLDDSRTSRVHDPSTVVSSSAYVLYYYKQKPAELKHRASRVQIPDVPEADEPEADK